MAAGMADGAESIAGNARMKGGPRLRRQE